MSNHLSELAPWLIDAEREKTKEDFPESTPGEVLSVATILRVLAEDTHQHADDERADGFHLTAETTDARASKYRDAYHALQTLYAE